MINFLIYIIDEKITPAMAQKSVKKLSKSFITNNYDKIVFEL